VSRPTARVVGQKAETEAQMMTRLLAVVLLAVPVSAAGQTTSLPIAYFSPQRAFVGSAEGKAAQAKLTSLQTDRSREIEARNDKLKAMQGALQQTGVVVSETARRQRQQEIDRFQVDLQRFIQDAQAEFLGVERQSTAAFEVKLRPALAAVARDKRLLLVINEDEGLIAWADPSLDITPDVIKRLDDSGPR
jgi:outer membrane protein